MLMGMGAATSPHFTDLTVVSYSHGTHCAGIAISGP